MMSISQRPIVPPVKPKTPSKPSLFGTLFNPRIGDSLAPMRESSRIFLRLLASVFAMYGLLTKDYPGLSDTTTKFSLISIMGSAWGNVRFTREGAPRAILFFAILGFMIFGVFFAAMTLLSLTAGKAHAQSVFAPATQDVAQSWIDYLFSTNGANVYPSIATAFADGTNAALVDPFSGSISLQTALSLALGVYSNAILIIAAIILFYHLTAMVVETAHHGVPMGKRASQIWAPIRLVVAIGLLVPVSAAGLNTGQYIVIKMAEMGSGLASTVWTGFMNQMSSYANTLVAPSPPQVQMLALNLIEMEACARAWNNQIAKVGTTGLNLSSQLINPPTNVSVGTVAFYMSNGADEQSLCGSLYIPPGNGNASVTDSVASIYADALNGPTGLAAFRSAAQLVDQIDPNVTNAPAPLTMDTTILDTVVAFQQTVNTAFASANLQSAGANSMSNAASQMTNLGWVMAGAYLNTLSRRQGNVDAAASAGIPAATGPDFGSQSHVDVATTAALFKKYMDLVVQKYQSNPTQIQCATMVGLSGEKHVEGVVDSLFDVINYFAVKKGVWTEAGSTPCPGDPAQVPFSLGVRFDGTSGTSKDPFAQMVSLGHKNMIMALDMLEISLDASLVSGATGGFNDAEVQKRMGSVFGHAKIDNLVHTIAAAGASIFQFLALIFWSLGFSLAFLLPMMPFMRFFFAVLAWVAALVEAIVAIPLVALAHLNPEGEGLAGQQASGAYFFVFNLFLRPVLTVFGLVAGLVLFLIAVSFLNYGYTLAIADAGGTAAGHAYQVLSRMIYSIMYVVILYLAANHCFQLIDHLPAHALSWMGKQGQSIPTMGSVDNIEGKAALISSYAAQQAIPNVGKLGGAAGRELQTLAGPGGAVAAVAVGIAHANSGKGLRGSGGSGSTLPPPTDDDAVDQAKAGGGFSSGTFSTVNNQNNLPSTGRAKEDTDFMDTDSVPGAVTSNSTSTSSSPAAAGRNARVPTKTVYDNSGDQIVAQHPGGKPTSPPKS